MTDEQDELDEVMPPTNVRVVQHPDGSIVPIELTYQGKDGDGIHVWMMPSHFEMQINDKIMIERMPPRTTVILEAKPNW